MLIERVFSDPEFQFPVTLTLFACRCRMLRLRCKTKNGSHVMQGLTHQSCVQELKSKVEELTGIPCEVQKIMVGYPPSSLDLRNGDAHLKDYPIKSGPPDADSRG